MTDDLSTKGETRFTPGPWRIARSRSGYPYQISAPNGTHVKHVTRWAAISVPSLPEGEANASLIAAAPALYKALQSCADTLQAFLDTFGDLGDRVTQADLDDWYGALSLARGQTPGASNG